MFAVAGSPAGWHRCMQSDELHTSTWRSEDPSTCPGLPSAILQSASSRIFALHWLSRCAGLCSSSDYGRTAVTATSTADGRSCCGFSSGQAGRDPLQVVQSLLATMQNSFLQQVKGLLGVTPPQLLIGPSVSSDKGQDVLRQPSPTGNQDASRAGPKSRS